MNINNLKYFAILADELNFTRAASKLFISQQALSNTINNLEKELATILFIRNTPLALTESGKLFYVFAQDVLKSYDDLKYSIKNIDKKYTSNLTVGTTLSLGNLLIPTILPFFKTYYPNVKMELMQNDTEIIMKLLLDKKIDLMVGITNEFNNSKVISEPIFNENYSLVFTEKCIKTYYPDNWESKVEKLHNKTDIKIIKDCFFLKMLNTLPLGQLFNNLCKEENFIPHISLEVRTIETMVACCMKGLGAIITPDIFISLPSNTVKLDQDDRLYIFPLNNISSLPSEISVIYLNNSSKSDMIQNFIKASKDSLINISLTNEYQKKL